MYAIIESGSKQYRVQENALIDVERLNAADGDEVAIDKVLLVNDGESHIGTPYVDGARVVCRVVVTQRTRKLWVFKYKPKTRYRRTAGHRQHYTRLRVEKIELGSGTRRTRKSAAAGREED